MVKSITKKFIAIYLSVLMAMFGLPLDVFAEAAKSTETFTSEQETIQVSDGTLDEGRSISFNNDWKFNKGDVSNAQSKDFDDSTWRSVDLPHDWSIEGDFTTAGEAESGFLLGGIGWYRKTFKLPENYTGKRVSIEFGGVYMNSTLYVNGREIGTHPYGYTPFAFDITDYLNFDGTNNVISVKVNHQTPSSRWYSGSGIYRSVNLVVTEDVHVQRYGTQVTTPNLENEKGGNVTVNMSTEVENNSDSSSTVTIKNTVYDASDNAVSNVVSKEETVESSATKTVAQTLTVNNPSLWSVDSPTMYYVKTEIVKDGNVIDEYTTDFGFRYFKFDRSTGFSLNGKKMKLKGVCMHHDQGALGAAANYNAIERQVKKLKNMGCNAIRVTHNPASNELLEICNKEGIMIIEEAFDGWARSKNGNDNDYARYFNKTISSSNKIMSAENGMTWAEFDIKQMVDRGKNNPCIIMWSLGNEVLEGTSAGTDDNYVTYARNLINWVKEVDTTRPTTTGDNKIKSSNDTCLKIADVIAQNGGIVGLNYSSDAQYSSLYNNHSNWTIYGSETSSAIRSRGVYTTTGQDNANHQLTAYDSARVGWGRQAADSWSAIIKNDYIAGEFVWTGFDYIGEPTPWNGTGTGSVTNSGPSPKSSYFGIIDTAGFEKDIYYFYQSQWNDKVNTLHILPCWDRDSISVNNGKVNVVVYSDAPTVELFLNGKSLGKKSFTKNTTNAGYTYQTNNGSYSLSWDVDYEEGILTAKAYDNNNNEITNTQGRNTVTTSGTPSKLNAKAEKSTIDADGYDLSYIDVDVTDANGNIDPNASNNITFNLTGNGKIVGVDNGDATDTSRYKPTSDTSATRKAFNGKALVIVQSTKKAGGFTLTASANGLESSSVTVNTKAVSDESQEAQIIQYKISKDYYVYEGVTPKLPTSVEATYSDETTKNVNINWDSYDANLLQSPNVFTVSGTLQGTDIHVKVNVHVVGNVVSALNYSTFTTAGVAPTLPEKVKVVLEDGTVSEEFPVRWDSISDSKYTNEGTFTVDGVITVLDKTFDVSASIRVDKALEESKNIAINNSSNSDVPTLSQDADPISDNLNSINDGVTNNSSDTNARWTNYNVRNKNQPVYVQMDWDNQYTIDHVNLYLFTDNYSGALPKNVTFYYYDGEDFVEIESSSTTPVSYTSGETTYKFAEPVKTDKLRISMLNEVGRCCGLTEVEVFNARDTRTANTEAKLSSLEINNTPVAGFDKDKKDYDIEVQEGEEVSVSANATDNAAVTVIPAFDNTIKVLVQSEDHKTVNTYNIGVTVETSTTDIDKSQLEKAINDANVILNNAKNKRLYTESTFNALKSAKEQAQAVLDNSSATQDGIDDVIGAINLAVDGLKERKKPVVDLDLSVNGDYIYITGKVDNNFGDYYEITSHGVLYIRKATLDKAFLTVNTPGRTRVNFGSYKNDGSFVYKFKPSNKATVYTMRAFVQYIDEDGNSHYTYSDTKSKSIQ